ncbi:MAG: hypothetical protein EOO56_26990 [Hymenobacter sp.]|nr:MAG: hypothetical protein EOO56_26990 [Hymenobacter sp.]
MPEPEIRFFLHSVAAASGHRVIYLSLGAGEKRPVRQATGYAAHPAYCSPSAPHLLKGADGQRTINEKLDELRLAVAKACRRLEDAGQLSNAALAPLFKAAVSSTMVYVHLEADETARTVLDGFQKLAAGPAPDAHTG